MEILHPRPTEITLSGLRLRISRRPPGERRHICTSPVELVRSNSRLPPSPPPSPLFSTHRCQTNTSRRHIEATLECSPRGWHVSPAVADRGQPPSLHSLSAGRRVKIPLGRFSEPAVRRPQLSVPEPRAECFCPPPSTPSARRAKLTARKNFLEAPPPTPPPPSHPAQPLWQDIRRLHHKIRTFL